MESYEDLKAQKDAILAKENKKVEQLEQAAIDALYIMSFHTSRCPMNIMQNFSGHEEHLAMYRRVIRDLQKLVGDKMDKVNYN